jgi:enterochelin esterase-like enzyme
MAADNFGCYTVAMYSCFVIWFSRHPIWELVDESTKLELELIYQDDGEFWFPLRLLPEHFDMVETCWVDEN